jgi:hypothetical protein
MNPPLWLPDLISMFSPLKTTPLEYFLFGRINDAVIRSLPCFILLVKQEAGT